LRSQGFCTIFYFIVPVNLIELLLSTAYDLEIPVVLPFWSIFGSRGPFLDTVERVAERVLYLLIFHILLFLFLWSYYQTVFSEIGQPQKTFYLTSEVRRDLESAADDAECRLILDRFLRQHQVPVANRAFDGSVRYCHKCNCVKPDRSHHCSFFVLFLGYGLALCLFGFFTDMQYFIAFWKNELKQNEGFGRFHILFLFFVSGMFAVSLSCLFFYHLYLTSRNQSTIGNFTWSLRMCSENVLILNNLREHIVYVETRIDFLNEFC
uniref:Palmitoyltransferase n=1 Tax=Parascaris equorum TaxID=6256 RepID=A0A914RCZ8_PAREQ